MRTLTFVLLITAKMLCATPSSSATAATIASSYEGEWHSTFSTRLTLYSRLSVKHQVISNHCRASGTETICEQVVDGKTAGKLSYRTTDAPGIFDVANLLPDGHAEPIGKLEVVGSIYTYPWSERHDDVDIHFRVVNVFVNPDNIRFEKAFSTDERHWTVMATGHERRVRK